MSGEKPIVSVVTIVKNDAEGFLATTRSILEQDYENIEWIVIDGDSSDGTAEYVRKMSNRIADARIEPDAGIYNAMNKGIRLVTGEWAFFMNAGDVFYTKETVSQYVSSLNSDDEIVYGDAIDVQDDRIKFYRPPDQYWAGMIFDHQSTMVRSRIYKERPYNESFKIAGDFDFFSDCRILGARFRQIPWLIGCRKPFDTGASSNYAKRQAERIRVIRRYFIDRPWRLLLTKEYRSAYEQGVIDLKESEFLMDLIGAQ